MSANPSARPFSRRSFLSTATAMTATVAPMVAIGAAEPDPVFVALAIEQAAWEAFERTCGPDDECGTAWRNSGWDREPRVQVGTYVRFVRGPNQERVPEDERKEEPVYLRSRAEIDRHETRPERRERFYRELDHDRRAIENHPMRITAQEAAERNDEALAAWSKLYREALSTRPTTTAGALALMATLEERDRDMAPEWELVRAVFDGVRAVIGGRA